MSYTPEWASKITDIPTDEIKALAYEYATTRRACIRVSESPEKADLHSFAVSIPILTAITGHLGQKGANKWFYPAARLGFDTLSERIPEERKKTVIGANEFYIFSRGRAFAHFPDVIESGIHQHGLVAALYEPHK